MEYGQLKLNQIDNCNALSEKFLFAIVHLLGVDNWNWLKIVVDVKFPKITSASPKGFAPYGA
jgi:hypothetical protein